MNFEDPSKELQASRQVKQKTFAELSSIQGGKSEASEYFDFPDHPNQTFMSKSTNNYAQEILNQSLEKDSESQHKFNQPVG